MATFLPLIAEEDPTLFRALDRIGPIILDAQQSVPLPYPPQHSYLFVKPGTPVDVDALASWLDEGIEKVILPLPWAKECIGTIPSDRLILLLQISGVSAVSENVRNGVSGLLLKTPSLDVNFISSISKFFAGSAIYVLSTVDSSPTPSNIRELKSIGATLVIPDSQLTLEPTSDSKIHVGDAFLAPVISDRPDGLFPTVVSSQTGQSLGLVYSSRQSVKESIASGKGVYQSRKHGLWRKGETSGATQDVLRIRLDCDSDSLEFRVIQHGAGFCHLNRQSCFSEISGLPALESTLKSRLASAPEGSYTKRLFSDPELLKSKIMEEADELCQATTKEDVAFEAADLFYFALTKCIASGVSVVDIEKALDKKAKRVTRRPGNAKPQWTKPTAPPASITPVERKVVRDGPIRMRISDLLTTTPEVAGTAPSATCLALRRDDHESQPIVDAVRQRGDSALLEFTAKFDRAQLASTVVFPPFAPRDDAHRPRGP
ncbi:hypothetical protein NLJ89_g7179 [Agrocybe chaxingu]|uniref:Phosphoribosyl-AMP cyclohydrolase domain-containing protein n=1 Tax=Agrocybe chaxingu TaxID=84603 RepID=A0A9W8MTY0_9AGAR|nr:hypothetical protein NLJ89_g7179 [Agrocybe chaxingu]